MRAQGVITGLGVVSSLGSTRDAFFDALAGGRCAIAEDAALAATGCPLAARIGDFGVKQYVDPRALRRLTRLSQLSLVAARQALSQAGGTLDPLRTGIVFATGLGTIREALDFLAGCLRDGAGSGSPSLFPVSVMNATAGQLAVELALRGVNTTLNHRELSPFAALALALDQLTLHRADALLVVAADELTDYTHHGYRRLSALSTRGLRPYARERDGTVLGEGAVALLIEREVDAAARGATALARIAGLAITGDVRPPCGVGSEHAAAVRAIRMALEEASLEPGAIDYVCGGGAGLRGDGLEALALAAVFPHPVACGSILGQSGEFMASGLLRVAAALYALSRQALPGTVGAGEADPGAPLPGLVVAATAASVTNVLVPSLAQGGANAALLLGRA